MNLTNLARSRALVRLDGPGHIMPIEPVTPPDSKVWRIIHFPVMLAVCALCLLVAAMRGSTLLLGLGLEYFNYVPGFRYLVPLIVTAAVILAYLVFVRIVERRRDFEELGGADWLTQVGLGLGGGLALYLTVFAVQAAAGGVSIEGFTLSRALVLPIVAQVCMAICVELVLRGLFFRLAERLLGSWMALLASAAFFGGSVLLDGMTTNSALAAAQSGLLFAAMYMVTRRLWAVIGLHAAIGVAAVELYGPNGFVVSRVAGPDWLTGGAGGADASLPGLAITALVITALLVVAIRRGRIVRPIWRSGRSSPAAPLSFG